MLRLLVAGVAWLAAIGGFAALVEYSARPRPTPTPPAVTALVKALNKAKNVQNVVDQQKAAADKQLQDAEGH